MSLERFREVDEFGRVLKEGFVQNGKESGVWYTYFENGEIESIKRFVDGSKSGIWEIHALDGSTRTEIEYENGKKIKQKTFSREGCIDAVSEYIDDKLHSITAYHSNNEIKSIYCYENNLPHGENKHFREDGSIESVVRYKKGKLSGTTEHFHANGKLKDSTTYAGDITIQCSYYENGQLEKERGMRHKKPHGMWKDFLENGQLISEMNFIDGREHGDHRRYYENGNLKSQIPYSKSRKHGVEIHHFSSGKLRKVATYYFGVRDGELKEYSEDGLLTGYKIYKNNRLVNNLLEK